MDAQRRSSLHHRRSNSFDIRNFSFMKSSKIKSQRCTNGKPIKQTNRLKRHSAIYQYPLSIQCKGKCERVKTTPSDSLNRGRIKSVSESEVPNHGQLSTEVINSWQRINKWPTQKLCSNEDNIDRIPKKYLQLKNESVQPKYVDKSCSPILQLVARYNNHQANKLEKTGVRYRHSSIDRRMLQKIDESITASHSSSQIPSDNEKLRDKQRQPVFKGSDAVGCNTTKCEHCGRVTEPNLNNGVEEHLIDDVADSVQRSPVYVPTPVVDLIRTEIVPTIENRTLDTENTNHFKSINLCRSTLPMQNIKYQVDTSGNTMKERRTLPFGILRRKVSPKNPMKGLYPPPTPVVKSPLYNWISPLPHTPGMKSPKGRTMSTEPSPISSSPSFVPSKVELCTMPPLAVVPKAVRLTSVPNKCIEWYEKIIQGEMKSTDQEKCGVKCEEWYTKIAGKERENTIHVKSNIQKLSSRNVEKKLKRTAIAGTNKEYKMKQTYSGQTPQMYVIPTVTLCKTKFAEENKMQSVQEEEKPIVISIQSLPHPSCQNENVSTELLIEEREQQKQISTNPLVQSTPFSPPRPAPITKTNRAATSKRQFSALNRGNYSPTVTQVPKGGESVTTKIQERELKIEVKPTSTCKLTNKRWCREYSRGDPKYHISSTTEGKLTTKIPVVLARTISASGSGLKSQLLNRPTEVNMLTRAPRLRKTIPTKVIPERYYRVSMQRDARNQIRMYKAKHGIAHSLNPFFWLKRTNEKQYGQQALVTKTAVMPFMSAVLGKPFRTIVGYSRPDWSGCFKTISPSIMPAAWSVMNTSNEIKPKTLPKLENGISDLICAKPELNGFKMANKRTKTIITTTTTTMTRAQMFRSQFIQRKIRLVNNHNDSWWKNFNSRSLPLPKKIHI